MERRARKRASKQRVLIAGGSVAGIEMALALRELAGDRVEIEIRDPREEFVYKPFSVGAPFGAARVSRYVLPDLAERCGASFELDSIASVDGDRRRAFTHDGEEVPYDYLVVACGARLLPGVPGACTFWGVDDEGGIVKVVRQLRANELRALVFTMPGGCTWGLPLYELALFAAAQMARSDLHDTRLTIVTPEDGPLQLFGTRAGEQMEELLAERGVELVTGAHPVKCEAGCLHLAPGRDVEADAVVSLPRMEGRRIAGIPHDSDGFIAVDEHCRVRGMERTFAAGDVTNFPVKQGGIATQEADAAAAMLASEIGGDVEPRPFDPVLRGVLWTGEDPRYLYGRLTGGHGETSTLSEQPPWPPQEGKILGRYLTPFLAAASEIEANGNRGEPGKQAQEVS
jgi:sulfide:quinone oxidoreductase